LTLTPTKRNGSGRYGIVGTDGKTTWVKISNYFFEGKGGENYYKLYTKACDI
jgi:hypothetical protein